MKNNHEFNWIKRRYKIYVIGASVLSGVVFSGGGIGIGYAIWANSNQPAPMPAPVTPSISALAEGSLKIDESAKNIKISAVGYNGASNIIVKVTGEGINNNNVAVSITNGIANVTLGLNPVASNYDLVVSNGSENTTVQITVESSTFPSIYNYASWTQVSKYFTVSGQTIQGFVSTASDQDLNKWMATNQFNGINFDTNITAIDNNVFKDSESLGSNGNISSIRFANLTSVGDSAFANCYSLEEITLGNNQNISIGISAFQNCKSLYRVIMDSTAKLKAIGTTAFGGCSQLISRNQFIITNENLNGIGTWIGTGKNAWIKKADNSGSLGSVAFGAIDISSLTHINEYAFADSVNLTDITNWPLNENITNPSIGKGAFSGCTNLAEIVLPDWATTVGEEAFLNCVNLVTFAENLKGFSKLISIGKSTFEGCGNLTTVALSDTITTIGETAFYNCSALWSVSFVDNQTTNFSLAIANSAFLNCNKLNRINLLTKTTLTDTIGEGAFNNCTANPGVITGKSSTITALATAIKNAMPTPANWSYSQA